MSITRTKHTTNYTVITNDLINDQSLDWDELGLLIYLISKPENWKISVPQLVAKRKSGRTKIYRILKKLQVLGYARYKRSSDGKVDWFIYDQPNVNAALEDKKPRAEKPHVEKPHVENQHVLVSNDLLQSNIKINKPPIVPQGDVVVYEKIKSLYNEILTNNPKCNILSDKRKKQIKRLWNYHDDHKKLAWWKDYFEHCNKSDFLSNQINSEKHHNFKVDLDWLTNFNNFAKIIDGKYHR